MTTGERIREIRRDQNISQTQLAQAAGLNQPQVSLIDGNGQTQAILRRGCYRKIVDIERLEDGRE